MDVVPVTWLRHAAEALGRDSAVMKDALAAAGLRDSVLSGDARPIASRAWVGFIETAASLAGDPLLGMRLGQSYDLRASGLVAYVSISAADLRAGMRNATRYGALNDTSADYALVEAESGGTFRVESRSPIMRASPQAVDFKVAGILAACRRWVGPEFRPLAVRFAHQRTAGRAEMEAWFGCRLRFGAPLTEMDLSEGQLDAPTTAADPYLLALLSEHAEQVLARQGRGGNGLPTRVARLVAGDLPGGVPTAARVASELGLSERTFARRLQDEGTSFRQIVEEIRREMARSYLSDAELSLAQVAYLLGYGDQSAFSNSFRRWTGRSPRRFRMELAA